MRDLVRTTVVFTRTVVPFTVMAEMLAQAAAVLVPGETVVALRDVHARKWIRYECEPITLELRAQRDPARPNEVRVSIRNRGQLPARSNGAEEPGRHQGVAHQNLVVAAEMGERLLHGQAGTGTPPPVGDRVAGAEQHPRRDPQPMSAGRHLL